MEMIAVPTNYKVTENNVHIEDSWRVGKRDFQFWIDYIREHCPNSQVWERKDLSLKNEWRTHNFLYALHIQRARTGSVDMNYPLKWYVCAAYNIIGPVAWLFIR